MASRARAAAVGAVLGVGVSAQSGAALAVTTFATVSATGVAGLRSLAAGALLCLAAPPSLRALRRGGWRGPLGFGISVAVLHIASYQALTRLPLGTAVTIQMLGPLVLVGATSRRMIDAGWVMVAGFGIVLVVGAPRATSVVGVLFALAAAVSIVGYLVSSRRIGREYTGLDGISLGALVAAVVSLPLSIPAAPDVGDLRTGAAIIGIAVLGAVIPYVVEWKAIRVLSVRLVGLLISADPVLAAIIGWVALGQTLTVVQWLGVLIVCAACAATVLSGGNADGRPGATPPVPP